jgi:hypothetical protein
LADDSAVGKRDGAGDAGGEFAVLGTMRVVLPAETRDSKSWKLVSSRVKLKFND